jgi:hypothetical protein
MLRTGTHENKKLAAAHSKAAAATGADEASSSTVVSSVVVRLVVDAREVEVGASVGRAVVVVVVAAVVAVVVVVLTVVVVVVGQMELPSSPSSRPAFSTAHVAYVTHLAKNSSPFDNASSSQLAYSAGRHTPTHAALVLLAM